MNHNNKKNPESWWADGGWHFQQGMWIQNLLREVISDEQLSTGNWDNHYIEILEKVSDRLKNG